jgi:hypothetical protein
MAFSLLMMLGAVAMSFFLVESPLWLLNKGDYFKGMEAIRIVCKMNGTLS